MVSNCSETISPTDLAALGAGENGGGLTDTEGDDPVWHLVHDPGEAVEDVSLQDTGHRSLPERRDGCEGWRGAEKGDEIDR